MAVLVMSYPHEGFGAAMNNNIDDVRECLDSKHAGAYMVYNLAEKNYEADKLHNKVRRAVSRSLTRFRQFVPHCQV